MRTRKMTSGVVLLGVSLGLLTGCAQAEKAQEVHSACADAARIGGDGADFVIKALNAGAIGFENANELIDAFTNMDNTRAQELGQEVAKDLPPVDAAKFRDTLDKYGDAVGKCRVVLNN